jgi:serine/threonine protein kinase
MKTAFYQKMGTYEKYCCCFDMMRQLLRPLERIHKNAYTFNDLKPDKICVRRRADLSPNFNAAFQFDP